MNLPTQAQIDEIGPRDHILKDLREDVARRGRDSLFFFARWLFGHSGLNERAHTGLCNHAQQIIRTPKALGVEEDPRGSGKSNAITIPAPAWILIQDPDECRRKGWITLGPETNIGVASYKIPYAVLFISDTKKRIEGNDLFRWAYPDIRPGLTWREEFWSIQRENTTGHSVMALGTESGATSLHPKVLLIDDMLNEKNYNSPSEVKAAVDWVNHSVDLVATENGSRVITQNEWSERGVNADLREKNKTNPFSTFFFSRSRIVCDVCEEGRVLDKVGNPLVCDHPEPMRPILDTWLSEPSAEYTMDDVEALKASMPRTQWFAQHINDPLAMSERTWRESYLRNFTWDPEAMESKQLVARMVVGKGGVSGGHATVDAARIAMIPVTSMEVTAAMDPGLVAPGLICSGRANVAEVGEMVFVLDECKKDRPSAKEQLYWLFDCVVKYKARCLVFENAALQGHLLWQTVPATAQQYEREHGIELPYWLTSPNPDAGRLIGCRIEKSEGSKFNRVENALSPLFEQRLVAVHPGITGWLDEYIIFPKGRRIDRLDAFAMTVKAWKTTRPLTQAMQEALDADIIQVRDRYDKAMDDGAGYNANIGV